MLKVSSLVVHIWLIPFLELQVAGQKTFKKKKNFPKLLNLRRQMSSEPAGPLFHGHFLKVSQGWIKISEIHRFGYDFFELYETDFCSIAPSLNFDPCSHRCGIHLLRCYPQHVSKKKYVVFSGKTFARLQTGWRSRFPSRQVAVVWDWLPLVTLPVRLDKVRSCSIMLHPWYITVIYGDIT